MLNQHLSIVVPVYNEDTILFRFHMRLKNVLETIKMSYDILYINDGSRDKTLAILQQLHAQDPSIGLINLSRNFGKEIALQAGIDYTQGDAVIVMDADLQDPPELIPEFIAQWQTGFDVVYARRETRKGESWFKKATAFLFYRILHCMSHVQIPTDTGDFRLMSRRAVEAIKQLREKHRYMKGLFAWIGYPQIAIPFQREPRLGGKSKWGYWKLFNLALEGITSFSIAPLKLATVTGLVTAIAAFLYAIVVVYKTLLFGEPVQGYPSLMVVILFLGGVQLISLGILGEYLGRMFMETKQRPLYLVQDYYRPKTTLGLSLGSVASFDLTLDSLSTLRSPDLTLDSLSTKNASTSNTVASFPARDAVTK